MRTSYGLDAYRSHDLNIAMRTSSGDIIKMDFSNKQSSSLAYSKDSKSSKTAINFSSQQAFQFSIKSNGISAQDKKEIDAFMKIAQPFIDKFLSELSQDAPKSPVTKLAKQIANIFNPNKQRTQNETNVVKTNIVKMFSRAVNNTQTTKKLTHEQIIDKILKESKKLLENTLKEFDNVNKNLYA